MGIAVAGAGEKMGSNAIERKAWRVGAERRKRREILIIQKPPTAVQTVLPGYRFHY
jgi:hypothetical protein